jgi:hypothetical protein
MDDKNFPKFDGHENRKTVLRPKQTIQLSRADRIKNREKVPSSFEEWLVCAIRDEANHLGSANAKQEAAFWIVRFLERQADSQLRDYVRLIERRFGRLTKRAEQVTYLKGQRNSFIERQELDFFDEYLNAAKACESEHELQTIVLVNLKFQQDILTAWKDCNGKPAHFIQCVPSLKQILEGLATARKLEFIEKEIGFRQDDSYISNGKSLQQEITIEQPLNKDEIRLLIVNDFERAIKQLTESVKPNSKILELSGKWHDVQVKYSQDLISFEKFGHQSSKIREALLKWIDELPD